MRLKSSKHKAYWLGLFAEYWVALCLMLKGYRIVARRYKTKVGEIDLIALRRGTLHFVEVKYRDDFSLGAQAVSYKSQQRIRRAAQYYLLVHGQESHTVNADNQCDVVLVSRYFFIKHIKNAF